VNLEVFEGPLDLLLYLIRKNDVDVYDIPIAFILAEYLTYLDTLAEMNIDLAGDFLLMAAELTHLKSKMLLPTEAEADEDEEGDPRADLVRRLLEYQRYKEASEELAKRPMMGRDVFSAGLRERPAEDDDAPIEANVFDLVNAFSTILGRISKDRFHEVAVDRLSVNDRIMQIVDMLKGDATVTIEELLPLLITKYDVVITFLAILEMAKLKMVRVYQGGVEDTIRIRKTMEEVPAEALHSVDYV
jgi:segregation and condensation protein A